MTAEQEILAGYRCPYCQEPSELINSSLVYGRYLGMMYRCAPCGAHVGTHKGTLRALGTLADQDTRTARRAAHKLFDEMWRRRITRKCPKFKARTLAYEWLSQALDIPQGLTHIGMFDEALCYQVIELCRPWHDRWTEQAANQVDDEPRA